MLQTPSPGLSFHIGVVHGTVGPVKVISFESNVVPFSSITCVCGILLKKYFPSPKVFNMFIQISSKSFEHLHI